MAIAIPLIMAASGASAALGAAIGVSASLVSVGVGVLGAVSGISDKVNKAASKVFGDDLVQVGNIAGAAFMAFGGGFPGGGPSGAELEAANAADMAGGLNPAINPAVAPVDAGALSEAMGGTMPSAEAATQLGSNADKLATAADTTVAPSAAAGPSAATAAQPTGALGRIGDTIGKFAGKAYDSLTTAPKGGVSPLWKIGGDLLAGAGSAYQRRKDMEAQMEAQQNYERERDARFRVGSGLRVNENYRYEPRTPTPGK